MLSLQLHRLHRDQPRIDGATALAVDSCAGPPTPALRLVSEPGDVSTPQQLAVLTSRATGFVQAVLEVLAGDRPCTQLLRWADPRVYSVLLRCASDAGRISRATARKRQRVRVVSVRVTCPAPGVAEVSARVRDGQRSRVIAARLDWVRKRWICIALEIG